MHIISSMIAQTSSPTTKGINAIQLWILGCVIFSFLSLIEFVVMLIHMRHKNKKHVNGGAVFDNFVDPTNNEEETKTSKQHLTKRDLSSQDMIYEATPILNTIPSDVAVHKVNCCQHQNGNVLDLNYRDNVRVNEEQPRELTRIYLYHDSLTLFGYPTFFLIYVGFYLWVYRKTIYGYIN